MDVIETSQPFNPNATPKGMYVTAAEYLADLRTVVDEDTEVRRLLVVAFGMEAGIWFDQI